MNLSRAFCKVGTPDAILGCDAYGVSLTQRLWEGMQISIFSALVVTTVILTIGLFAGAFSSSQRPWVSYAFSSLTDIVLSLPGLLLAILISALLNPSLVTVIFSLSVTGWAGLARLTKSILIDVQRREYVSSAVALGANKAHVFYHHYWPSIWPHYLVQALLIAAYAVIGEASLSFLGLGLPVDSSSLGRLIAEGSDYLVEAPHISIVSGSVLFITMASLYAIASFLRKTLDPRHIPRLR